MADQVYSLPVVDTVWVEGAHNGKPIVRYFCPIMPNPDGLLALMQLTVAMATSRLLKLGIPLEEVVWTIGGGDREDDAS